MNQLFKIRLFLSSRKEIQCVIIPVNEFHRLLNLPWHEVDCADLARDTVLAIEYIFVAAWLKCNNQNTCVEQVRFLFNSHYESVQDRLTVLNCNPDNNNDISHPEIMTNLKTYFDSLEEDDVRNFHPHNLWDGTELNIAEIYDDILFLQQPENPNVRCTRRPTDTFLLELERLHMLHANCSNDVMNQFEQCNTHYFMLISNQALRSVEDFQSAGCDVDYIIPVVYRLLYHVSYKVCPYEEAQEAMRVFKNASINYLARRFCQFYDIVVRTNILECYYSTMINVRNTFAKIHSHARLCSHYENNTTECKMQSLTELQSIFTTAQHELQDRQCSNAEINEFLAYANYGMARRRLSLHVHLGIFAKNSLQELILPFYYNAMIDSNYFVNHCNEDIVGRLKDYFERTQDQFQIADCIQRYAAHCPYSNGNESCLDRILDDYKNEFYAIAGALNVRAVNCPSTDFNNIVHEFCRFIDLNFPTPTWLLEFAGLNEEVNKRLDASAHNSIPNPTGILT